MVIYLTILWRSSTLDWNRSLEAFFAQSDVELKRLLGWKADWLNQFPKVSLAELHQAQTELSEIKNQLPSIQERLRVMLNPLDWSTISGSPDLHQEMRICAELMPREEIEDRGESTGGIILPGRKKSYRPYLPDSGACRDKYEFAQSKGGAHDQVISHLNKIASRFEELVSLYEKHHKLLSEAEAHLAEENFRSAERVVKIYDNQRFPDIDYKKVDTLIQRQLTVWQKFNDLNIRINSKNYKEISHNLRQVQGIDIKSGSELANEISGLTQKIEHAIDAYHQARKKSMMTKSIVIFLIVVAIGTLSAYVIQEEKKVQLVAAEAKAKAEQEAAETAEAKAKAEREAAEKKAKFQGKNSGEERVWEILPGVKINFCWCPAGEFNMGSPVTEADRERGENQARVILTQGFWIAKTEITHAQWKAVMGNNPITIKKESGDNFPIDDLSWYNTREFLEKINAKIGNNDGGLMVLPTEAQWEYACRAGETGPFSGGTIDQVAWYEGNSGDKIHQVGMKKPNAWGLHDMHGNVSEWCADWCGDFYSNPQGGTDPKGASFGESRMIRGGNFFISGKSCRSASRSWTRPKNESAGFRIARIFVIH
jgi:formylglycine-generating enzyme required for sulfatase activity